MWIFEVLFRCIHFIHTNIQKFGVSKIDLFVCVFERNLFCLLRLRLFDKKNPVKSVIFWNILQFKISTFYVNIF